MKLPEFIEDGVLPQGDFELTLGELKESMLVRGPRPGSGSGHWDREWRLKLVENLEVIVAQLVQVGISEIFVNGSFVEDKDHPNDIDGYFVCDKRHLISGDLERELNLLDPHKIWTWDPRSRRPYPGYEKRQLPMWHACTESSSIRITGKDPESRTNTATSSSFPRRSGSREGTTLPRASFE